MMNMPMNLSIMVSVAGFGMTGGLLAVTIALASANSESQTVERMGVAYRAIVNGNGDEIKPDNVLTLREAIEVTNGKLIPSQLSAAEQAQLTPNGGMPVIGFNLPAGQTRIELQQLLPAVARTGTLIDGTTQPRYDKSRSATREIEVAIPVVEITPARGAEVLRGLTLVGNNIAVRGLSLYGFTSQHRSTALTPPADIFISHFAPPPNIDKQQPPANFAPYYPDDKAPRGIVIEQNWLGISPQGQSGVVPSAFGVSVFNGVGTQIRNNRIEQHDGSGIITSVNAQDSIVERNIIVGNGLAGMPDAIRLEGEIDRSQIRGNLMCGNDGAGVYLFKPNGSVKITGNDIRYNGRRLRRAAVYLTGSGHEVKDNQISHQAGSGVVVGAYPKSDRNVILDNRFDALEGLSIDLNAQENTYAQAWQTGDGPNPIRKGHFRHIETGNRSINAPDFIRDEFSSASSITGIAEPKARVDVYKIAMRSDFSHGPLSEPIAQVQADGDGKFSLDLTGKVNAGDRISATATDERGTSEPAINAAIGSWSAIEQAAIQRDVSDRAIPPCTTPPIQTPLPTVSPLPKKLQIPNRVHFALDQDFISPESSRVLDRIAAVLIQNPGIQIDLEGHTDPRASDDYNQDLGMRRARNVRRYLQSKGIDLTRMTLRSQGETRRVSRGNSPLDTARDRRVELIYRNSDGIELLTEETDLQPER